MLEESLERVLCRTNNVKRCAEDAAEAVEQVVQNSPEAVEQIYRLQGEAVIAARVTLGRLPRAVATEAVITQKEAAEAVVESLKTIIQKTNTLEDAANILEDLIGRSPIRR